ncbi:MAG: GNAT family N-acetyltransferase [Planctomycetota bacterium]|jgi:predicted N-acetyltransferase YhbS
MAIAGPKAASRDEIDSVVRLADLVFRPGADSSMGDEFPLLFHPDNVENLRVFTDGGEVVAHVGMLLRGISLLGSRHLSCCIGSVCTHPDYRGQGLATRLMDDAREKALEDGVDIFLISGGRGLYRRQGYVDVGAYRTCTVERSALPDSAGYVLRPWRPADIPDLVRLNAAEPVRFVRPPEDFLAFLGTGRVVNVPGELLIVCAGGSQRPVAYVACQVGGAPWDERPEDAITITEMAGPRWAIVQALGRLLDEKGVAELTVDYLGCDAEFAELGRSLGWRSQPRGFRGTVGIIDPARFWQASAPLFAERLGAKRAAGLDLDAGEPLRITYEDNEVVVGSMSDMTNLVFLPPHRRHELEVGLDRSSELAGIIGELFPLPLVDYGLNYI